MKPRPVYSADFFDALPHPLSTTKEGDPNAEDRPKGSEQGSHRREHRDSELRRDVDGEGASQAQAVIAGRAVSFARAARPAHVRGAS